MLNNTTRKGKTPGQTRYLISPVTKIENPSLNILIVEDDPVIGHMIEYFLGKKQCRTHWAQDGEQAVSTALQLAGGLDLILMDMHLPLLDGAHACQRIRAEWPAAGSPPPIIGMSGDIPDEPERFIREAGLDDLVGKPLHLETLEDIIHRWTGQEHRQTRTP